LVTARASDLVNFTSLANVRKNGEERKCKIKIPSLKRSVTLYTMGRQEVRMGSYIGEEGIWLAIYTVEHW